ncbi:sensor histidine kinase KdpD [Adlercreutzia sp. ZJ242]|uniref:sensor histidine kinase n=1 Tax=Adlercreutzia sp. ZJ242 TaxID=2709409 RepID=UPI0013EB86AF|nr:HAMP domain-containing sensor histidine kinase [Adlercreutzia sp. ZJ242]
MTGGAFASPTAIALLCIGCAALAAALGAAVTARCVRRRQDKRLLETASYLERAALGRAAALTPTGEDALSKLQDEIVKTVSALRHARAQADEAKASYADNLHNIAHQLKTPLAAQLLAEQRLKRYAGKAACADGTAREADRALDSLELDCIADSLEAQTKRLIKLQDDLLLLARMDSGALEMHPLPQDAFTLLSMAADSLEEIAGSAGVRIEVEDNGDAEVLADAHWICEALMNVMKNCVEHAPRGSVVRAAYRDNPLYLEMRVADEGAGFAPEDLPHLFERFYRGASHAKPGMSSSTGLGLAFARELIERQNGVIRARNAAGKGALFEIRIYHQARCHPRVT